MKKLPQITALFWVIKIAATTLGETGGDLLAQTLHLGYAAASILFIAVFVISLFTQMRAKKFHPALFWTVIVATSTAGTTLSDFLNRTLGLGYPTGAAILLTGLTIVFVVWARSRETFDMDQIRSVRGELLFWIAILLSNTLGTSVGDFLADSSGLGFGGGAAVIAITMALIVATHYLTPISGVVLFWIAFVLTRPLGATVGDFFSKPHDAGGLEFGTIGSSAILAGVLVVAVAYSHSRLRRDRDDREPELVKV